MTVSSALATSGTSVRPSTSFEVDIAVDDLPAVTRRVVAASSRFDLVDLGDDFATVYGAVSWRSMGELIELGFAAHEQGGTLVRISVQPLVKTTRVDSGQGIRDLRTLSEAIVEAASVFHEVPTAVAESVKFTPKVTRLAMVGFVLSCIGVVALGADVIVKPWLLPHSIGTVTLLPISMLAGGSPVLGIAYSRLAVKLTRLGMRGRGLAITGVVLGCVVPAFVLAIVIAVVIAGIIGLIALFL